MSDYLDNITMDDLDERQRDIAECIGLQAYISLLRTYAGTHIDVRMPDTITIGIRNREIVDNFDGTNVRELANKYGLSESYIYRIVSGKIGKIKLEPPDGQTKLW